MAVHQRKFFDTVDLRYLYQIFLVKFLVIKFACILNFRQIFTDLGQMELNSWYPSSIGWWCSICASWVSSEDFMGSKTSFLAISQSWTPLWQSTTGAFWTLFISDQISVLPCWCSCSLVVHLNLIAFFPDLSFEVDLREIDPSP